MHFDGVLNDDYPKYKRLITVVDNRTSNGNIWMFEPVKKARNISKDVPIHCYWPLSMVSLFPNMTEDIKDSLLTFSFRIKDPNCTKCYSFWKRTGMVFEAENIINVLPILFCKKKKNMEFFGNKELISNLVEKLLL